MTTVPKLDTPNGLYRFCRDCEWAEKRLTESWDWGKCEHPNLPVSLVTGHRVFPCVIVRGYEELCGHSGKWFTPRRR